MPYEMGMKDEKAPTRKMLLPEGWRQFKIINVEETKSKAGNLMFVFVCQDKETEYHDTWYAVGEPKKRWLLKQILAACGVDASADGVYKWDIEDVINKDVAGQVIQEDNDWINRDGDTITSKQHKIVDVDTVDSRIVRDE